METQGRQSRIELIGFLCLVLLTAVLPFDLTQRQLLQTPLRPVTDLTVVLCLVLAAAAASIIRVTISHRHGAPNEAGAPRTGGGRWRWSALFLLILVLTSALSSVAVHRVEHTLPWIADMLAGGILCLAIPVWLAAAAESRITILTRVFVAGACVAAIVGLAEFWLGARLERWLVWFRPGPTTMGPYLRLTSTFDHANEAAMYFGLALPFALAGLAVAARRGRAWPMVAAWAITADILLLALLLTYSRGGLVGLAASLVAMAVASRRTWGLRPLLKDGPALVVTGGSGLVVCLFVALTLPIEALRLTTQNDATWYRTGYISAVPASLRAGMRQHIPVTVENLGLLPWTSSAPHEYGLSYHWLYPSWTVAQFDNPITWLSAAGPGGRQTVRATIRAPNLPGRYLLVWDVLWHGSTWLGLKTGAFQPYAVRVTPPPVRSTLHRIARRSPALPPLTRLPLAQTATRLQIWGVALRLIERYPLLGMGPHGFRRHYAQLAPVSPQGRVPPPSNAHNLVLELTADWGLVGAAAFVALMVTLWWPLVTAAWRGQTAGWWQVAVIGAGAAFAGHGLVEYFLGTPAILLAFWLLCGLAVAAGDRARAA